MLPLKRAQAYAAATLLTLTASGCMTSSTAHLFATEADIKTWMNECDGNRGDPVRRAHYCTLIIKSDPASTSDRAHAYAIRGHTHYEQGQHQDAVSDLTAAIRLAPNNRSYLQNRSLAYAQLGDLRRAREDAARAGETQLVDVINQEEERTAAARAAEREARRRFAVTFEGIACSRLPRDENLFNPGNEIYVNTFTPYGGETYVQQFPSDGNTYHTASSGYRSDRGKREIVRVGPTDPVRLSVAMWERDGGGDAINVIAAWASLGISGIRTAKAGPASPSNPGSAATGYSPPGQPTGGEYSPGIVDGLIGQALKGIFGTENENFGVYHLTTTANAKSMALSSPRSENGFIYNLRTEHTGSGASCRTYLSIKEVEPATD